MNHDCPVCDATIDYRAVFDDGACPKCNTERSVVLSVADGVVAVDDLEPAYDGASQRVIPAGVKA